MNKKYIPVYIVPVCTMYYKYGANMSSTSTAVPIPYIVSDMHVFFCVYSLHNIISWPRTGDSQASKYTAHTAHSCIKLSRCNWPLLLPYFSATYIYNMYLMLPGNMYHED